MAPIPWEIELNEVLVRFISLNDFKNKKNLIQDKIKGDVFFPYKGGVSLQRIKYTNENFCRIKALLINKSHLGYLVFEKKKFIDLFESHKEQKKNFGADIIGTPMDENDEYYPDGTEVYIDSEGSPAHADIIYNEYSAHPEYPKPKMRLFTREMIKSCKYIIEGESKTESSVKLEI